MGFFLAVLGVGDVDVPEVVAAQVEAEEVAGGGGAQATQDAESAIVDIEDAEAVVAAG
jgi:hypothetical protein